MALIAIYDSGVGGLSVYQHAVSKCSQHDYLFVSDNQAFPYGTKSEAELRLRAKTLIERVDDQVDLDVLIVACNTASTIVLPDFREYFDFQIIGVVPAIKPAAKISTTKEIGLLATPATIDRRYTHELIKEFASDCKITNVGSSELVLLAEDKLYGRGVDEQKLTTILAPVIANRAIDVLVLACTHFPLLRGEISLVFERENRSISIIDSGDAIANRLSSIEKEYNLRPSFNPTRTVMMTASDIDSGLATQLKKMGLEQFQHLSV